MKTEKRGGKRENAGRKPYTYKTVQVSLRVREDVAKEFKKAMLLKRMELQG
jgi:hypothetical protein